jgi:hypothetical protein
MDPGYCCACLWESHGRWRQPGKVDPVRKSYRPDREPIRGIGGAGMLPRVNTASAGLAEAVNPSHGRR